MNNSIYFLLELLSIAIVSSRASFLPQSYLNKFFFKLKDDTPELYRSQDTAHKHHKRDINHAICDDNQLLLHLANLDIIGPDRIVTLITGSNINDFCQRINTTLEAVDRELQNCVVLSRANLYIRLLNGTQIANRMLCTNNSLRDGYKKYEECIQQLHEEYLECEGPEDWFEDLHVDRVCDVYESIINCNYFKTAELCGLEAAHYTHALEREIFKAVTLVDCKLPNKEPQYPEPIFGKMTTSGGVDKVTVSVIAVITVATIVVWS